MDFPDSRSAIYSILQNTSSGKNRTPYLSDVGIGGAFAGSEIIEAMFVMKKCVLL